MAIQGPFGQLAVEAIEPRWRAYSDAIAVFCAGKPNNHPLTKLHHVFSEIDFATPARIAQNSFEDVVRSG